MAKKKSKKGKKAKKAKKAVVAKKKSAKKASKKAAKKSAKKAAKKGAKKSAKKAAKKSKAAAPKKAAKKSPAKKRKAAAKPAAPKAEPAMARRTGAGARTGAELGYPGAVHTLMGVRLVQRRRPQLDGRLPKNVSERPQRPRAAAFFVRAVRVREGVARRPEPYFHGKVDLQKAFCRHVVAAALFPVPDAVRRHENLQKLL